METRAVARHGVFAPFDSARNHSPCKKQRLCNFFLTLCPAYKQLTSPRSSKLLVTWIQTGLTPDLAPQVLNCRTRTFPY